MRITIDRYFSDEIQIDLLIENIMTIHYFEYSKDYMFHGEQHDFWEFLYVDKGTVIVHADEIQHVLRKGEVIFHQPNEYHNVIANGEVAPNLIVVSFVCKSPCMDFFRKRIMQIDHRIMNDLSVILNEARQAYSSNLSHPNCLGLERSENGRFASEQLIKNHLELILIKLIRNEDKYQSQARTSSVIHESGAAQKLNGIVQYLQQHVQQRKTLDEISHDTMLSKSSMQKLFAEYMNISVMEYFTRLKIDHAKQLIRQGDHNFTQIADLLGYQSVHYFSRLFKKKTQMTLSEYASSVKALVERSDETIDELQIRTVKDC